MRAVESRKMMGKQRKLYQVDQPFKIDPLEMNTKGDTNSDTTNAQKYAAHPII